MTTEGSRTQLVPPSNYSFAIRFLVMAVTVFAALAISHRTLLWIQPWHEHSDYAVDAMHIERARHFQEIYGQYSRFGFSHPGPAFYYVYALGEQVFFRWLHLVPSPYNAHVLSGLILQCSFFAAALAIAAEWVRRPLFIPLALLTSALHLTLADNEFISTWPPRVLLMPLLCFIVAASSLASGRISHLPLTVLAGCFLVHGHVAQPLYVVPLFIAAYWLGMRRAPHEPGRSLSVFWQNRAAHWVSAICIGVFLAPLLIDLNQGVESNLAQILEFHRSDHGPGKPWWKALVYFCGYFGYVKKTEGILSVTGPERAAVIGEQLLGYFAWGAIVIIVLVYARRLWLRPSTPSQLFLLYFTAFTFVAFLLSLYWGTLQIGSMYEYNGYFFYAILHCILFLFCAVVSMIDVPRPQRLGLALCAGAALLAWRRQSAALAIDYSTNLIPPAVRKAVEADPLSSAGKYLLFNRGDWGEAVSIGLALKRAGLRFEADSDWGPKFSRSGGFEPTPPDFDMKGLSTWRLSRLGPIDLGTPIRDNLRVYFHPLPLDPMTAVIDCGENGNLELYNLFGFESPLGRAAWTISTYAGLIFASPTIPSDITVKFDTEASSAHGPAATQPVTVSVNGRDVFTGILSADGSASIRVSAEVWNAKTPVMMVLHYPDANSAHDLGRSLDMRKFGWHIRQITFQPVR